MLETAHGCDYYLAKADEHPFLKEAVEDSASFRARLDDLVIGLLSGSGDLGKTLTEFTQLTGILAECSPEEFDVKSCNRDAYSIGRYHRAISDVTTAAMYTGVVSLSLLAPPFVVLEAWLFGVGALALATSAPVAYRGWKAMRNAIEVFAPVCSAAVALDDDIGKAFLMDDFLGKKERFGETYRKLAPEERKGIDAELYRMLSGGALDMGEAELDSYLGSLLENEVALDA